MVKLVLHPSVIVVEFVKLARCQTVENVNTVKTCSSLEEVVEANRHVSKGDAPTWRFRVQRMEKRILKKI